MQIEGEDGVNEETGKCRSEFENAYFENMAKCEILQFSGTYTDWAVLHYICSTLVHKNESYKNTKITYRKRTKIILFTVIINGRRRNCNKFPTKHGRQL
jgi:hypothetical protein